ncbi:MAG: hypothetical protein KC636_27355, partial [Myxococcales bacterium]|nr:hypothetical protein [Myxococcales bacterium]
MHRGTTIFLLSTSIGAALAFACAPQVDPHYSGEPLATLRGAVVSDGEATAADVAVLWFKSGGNQCAGPSVYCSAGGGGGAEGAACAEACGAFPTECNEEVLASFGACVQACGWDFSYDVGWELCVDAGV